MSNSKLELIITTDTNGKHVELTNLSLVAAKSLQQLLGSLINILDATPDGNQVRISVIKGSATVVAVGQEITMNRLQADFNEVVEYRSMNTPIVHNWRSIQNLILANGLKYEVNFYNSSNAKIQVLDKIKNAKGFKIKAERKPRDYELVFVKGKLIENGGVKPNLHVFTSGELKVINCDQITAVNLNKHLYGDLFLCAWKRKDDHKKSKLEFCDSYLTSELFEEFKNFIDHNAKLSESDEYVSLHQKLKSYIEHDKFGMVVKLLRLYSHKSSEHGSLKTILMTTRNFKDREEIKKIRLDIKNILDSKLRKAI